MLRPRAKPDPLHPSTRRELVGLLYTALPQVAAITLTSVIGAVVLAATSGDSGYAAISVLIALTAAVRLLKLRRFPRGRVLADAAVIAWERAYGLCSSLFALALGALSFRALQLGDGPGAWVAFGLAMSFCVGMVSRAAVRPWIVLLTGACLLTPIAIAGFMRPELPYRVGAAMLLLFWLTLREASRHLSTAFIERLDAKRALAHQAHHDFLTGLPNRAAFLAELDRLRGAANGFALVAVDLDRFKPVNDQCGHHAGDEVLRQVAGRLRALTRAGGVPARLGGDEFMLLLPFATPRAEADAAMLLARRAVASLAKPFDLDDLSVTIGASAGILLVDGGDGRDGLSLVEQVDRALYAAKQAGGGRWAWANAAGGPPDGPADRRAA